MKTLLTEQVTSRGGRSGTIASADGKFTANLVRAKALGGRDGAGTNPEQLFGAGYSACFLSSIAFVAEQRKIVISPETTVSATVDLGVREDGGFAIVVALDVTVPDLDRATIESLVAAADHICPYSHAIRGNVPVTISIA